MFRCPIALLLLGAASPAVANPFPFAKPKLDFTPLNAPRKAMAGLIAQVRRLDGHTGGGGESDPAAMQKFLMDCMKECPDLQKTMQAMGKASENDDMTPAEQQKAMCVDDILGGLNCAVEKCGDAPPELAMLGAVPCMCKCPEMIEMTDAMGDDDGDDEGDECKDIDTNAPKVTKAVSCVNGEASCKALTDGPMGEMLKVMPKLVAGQKAMCDKGCDKELPKCEKASAEMDPTPDECSGAIMTGQKAKDGCCDSLDKSHKCQGECGNLQMAMMLQMDTKGDMKKMMEPMMKKIKDACPNINMKSLDELEKMDPAAASGGDSSTDGASSATAGVALLAAALLAAIAHA